MDDHFAQPRQDQPNKGSQTCRVCGRPIKRTGKQIGSDGVRGQWKHVSPALVERAKSLAHAEGLFQGGYQPDVAQSIDDVIAETDAD